MTTFGNYDQYYLESGCIIEDAYQVPANLELSMHHLHHVKLSQRDPLYLMAYLLPFINDILSGKLICKPQVLQCTLTVVTNRLSVRFHRIVT